MGRGGVLHPAGSCVYNAYYAPTDYWGISWAFYSIGVELSSVGFYSCGMRVCGQAANIFVDSDQRSMDWNLPSYHALLMQCQHALQAGVELLFIPMPPLWFFLVMLSKSCRVPGGTQSSSRRRGQMPSISMLDTGTRGSNHSDMVSGGVVRCHLLYSYNCVTHVMGGPP